MGWLVSNGATRRQVIQEILGSGTSIEGQVFKTLRHCFRGNTMYALHESGPQDTPRKWLSVYLLQRYTEGWGYKAISEDMGPYHCDCPVDYLDAADEPVNDTARTWREACRVMAARKAEQRAKRPQVGEVWSCSGRNCKRIKILEVSGNKIIAANLPGGGIYRIPKKLLGERMAMA